MAKRTRTQRRGKGSSRYRATQKAKAKVSYPVRSEETISGELIELIHDPIRSSVLGKILLENGDITYLIAPEGVRVGQRIQIGSKAQINIGNILPLENIPEGCPIFSIENSPGDGGELIRSSGSYGLVVTKDTKYAYVKLPSGKQKPIRLKSRATIGCTAAGGRKEKPMLKAGNQHFKMKARGGRRFPDVRGVARNARDHPFGGSQHHPGKAETTSRHASPGRKVGHIAASRTGRRKK